MHVVGVLPARMGSSRFPGKPLAPIGGVPMIGHVYYRSSMARRLDAVYIATCDREIADYGATIGAPVLMTSPHHERASDRTAEAVDMIERDSGREVDVVVMIQGDEPMVSPSMIEAAVDALIADERADVVNLMGVIDGVDAIADPNEIKVVTDRDGFALYFSRAPIPFDRGSGTAVQAQKQICIMPFRRRFLAQFGTLAPTPLEIAESVDMLRVIEHGFRVKMVPTDLATVSVDTPEDLLEVERLLASDSLVAQYRR